MTGHGVGTDWTDDILGMGSQTSNQFSHAHPTLEAEVDAYLGEQCFCSDKELLKFWQVSRLGNCDTN